MPKTLLMMCALSAAGCTASSGSIGNALFYGSLAAVTSIPAAMSNESPRHSAARLCNGSSCGMTEDCVGFAWFEHCEMSERIRVELIANTGAKK